MLRLYFCLKKELQMLIKKYSQDGKSCLVTFTLPAQVHASAAHLYGDFTEWEKSPQTMMQQEDGGFSITLSLATGQDYRFRYLLDGRHWENDWAADAYVSNPFGTEDSVLKL
jgi:1,4-alpha-glucan branching enzyme